MAYVSDDPAGLSREKYAGLELACDPLDRVGRADYVGGGASPGARTLAKLTIRRRVRRALDLGTGGGIQALMTARHADVVVGVDINDRALGIAEGNASRNGVGNVELRKGSWLEAVRGERFDLVLANPPYVISPESELVYRDSGERGDALVLRLLAEMPGVMRAGARGTLQPVPGGQLVRRLSLDGGGERISFEVRPNVGFAVRVDDETADALARGRPLPPAAGRRLAGLGMLLTPPNNGRKIEAVCSS